jgi:hypothetical protein
MIHVVSGVMNDWRVNRCWFDQGYPNWGLFLQRHFDVGLDAQF